MTDKAPSSAQAPIDLEQYVKERMQGERLDVEAIRNRIVSVVVAASMGANRLKPYPTYREWLLTWEPKYVDVLMSASDPKAIEKYDAEVTAFNADMERIKRENDVAAIRIFAERVLDISKNG